MKKILFVITCIIIVLSLVACAYLSPDGGNNTDPSDGDVVNPTPLPNPDTTPIPDPTPDPDPEPDPEPDVVDPTPEPTPEPTPVPTEPTEEELLFNELFSKDNHISVRLDIPERELLKLENDYNTYKSKGSKSPIYRMADLYITITTPENVAKEYKIEQVGVRMKGNTSRTNFYSESDGMYNLIHFKIDFGETFDDEDYYGDDAIVWESKEVRKERKNRTFATLEKLELKWNRNFDTTYIREGYAFDFYREAGVIVPHTNLASVDVNDDHAGVWVMYEPIDDIFLEKNLPEEALGGDLYKLGWTNQCATFTSFSSYGVEDEDKGQFFVYDLKTNKKKSDHSSLKNLIEMLNSDNLTKEQFESLVDSENFIAYCAVSFLVGNPDDLRNNYNNTYIYFRKDNGKMIIIPHDLDRVFGVNTWNPYGTGNVSESPFSSLNACGTQSSPLFIKTIQKGGFLINEFAKELSKLSKNEMLDPDNFATAYQKAYTLYKSEARPSKNYNNASKNSFYFDIDKTCNPSESNNMSFKDYITAKLSNLSEYVTEDGQPICDYQLYVRGDFNNWEINEDYKMTKVEEGVYSFDLSKNKAMIFKIYVSDTNGWYGAEFIDENCTVEYESVTENKDAKLKKGNYTIYFYIDTNTINIVSK